MGLAALAFVFMGTSCSDDDNGPSYSTGTVDNTALRAVLTEKGYTFSEDGKLLLNDLALNTTALDLSGTNLDTAALRGLSILPNLKEVSLANNGYGKTFDFNVLPAQITGVDLTGNEIYDFEGLVNATVDNDEVKATILRQLAKLYLPATAKYNVEDLMPFYTQCQAENKTVDMQMADGNGALQAYSTLREIPDQYFRAYLKLNFASIFADETHIDISKPMGLEDRGKNIFLQYDIQFADIAKIESLEGLEYFVNNPFYQSFYVYISIPSEVEQYVCHRMSPRGNVRGLNLYNTDIRGGLDLSKATSLASIGLSNNPSITSLDLTNTVFINQPMADFDIMINNGLTCTDCENLEEININQNNQKITNNVILANLPKLRSVNLQSIEGIGSLILCQLPLCEIVYPQNLIGYYRNSNNTLYDFATNPRRKASFAVSQEVLDQSSTKAFLEKYKENLNNEASSYSEYGAVTQW